MISEWLPLTGCRAKGTSAAISCRGRFLPSVSSTRGEEFDAFFLTIRPDYSIVVRDDILRESDGPMLIHGLQGINGCRILTPRKPELRPDPELLARRYKRFSESLVV